MYLMCIYCHMQIAVISKAEIRGGGTIYFWRGTIDYNYV